MTVRSRSVSTLVLGLLILAPLTVPGAAGLLSLPEEEGPVDARVTVRPVCPLPEICAPHEMRMYEYTWEVQACVEGPQELSIVLVVEQEPNVRVVHLAPRAGEDRSCFHLSNTLRHPGPDCVYLSAALSPALPVADPRPGSPQDDDAECVVLGAGPIQLPVISDG